MHHQKQQRKLEFLSSKLHMRSNQKLQLLSSQINNIPRTITTLFLLFSPSPDCTSNAASLFECDRGSLKEMQITGHFISSQSEEACTLYVFVCDAIHTVSNKTSSISQWLEIHNLMAKNRRQKASRLRRN